MKQKTFYTLLIIVYLLLAATKIGTVAIAEEKNIIGHYNETLKGRGVADIGREEPDYVNVIGYLAVSHNQEFNLKNTKNFQNRNLWVVPTYERDKQFLNESGTLPHKTEVVVLEQFLTHKGYGFYNGYLLVEKKDDKSQYYIDVKNFITKPYWKYENDLNAAAATGCFIAKYKQVSDYYPVTSDGEKVKIPDKTIVLVTGLAGTSSYYDRKTTSIEAVVWKKWRYGYGGVECYFNSADLTIVY